MQARSGKLARADDLRRKVRYFSDGAMIGGKALVEWVLGTFRERFGPKRKDGARSMRGLAGSFPDERLFNSGQ